MKKIKIKYLTVPLWERKGFLGTLKITNEYEQWNRDERTLLTIGSALDKKKKLPINVRKEIIQAMILSHQNASRAFAMRLPSTELADLKDLITQLV